MDLNRPKGHLPPRHPDGLVKSSTCYGRPVYLKGMEPGPGLVARLISKYYDPYYDAIERACADPHMALRLCLDCHSMAPAAPPVSGNSSAPGDAANAVRPLFCLSNRDGATCPGHLLERLARCMSDAFGVPRARIFLNSPFRGGHITEWFGARYGASIPWVQVEMNRALYMDERWFDPVSMQMTDSVRLAELRQMFEDSLVRFFD